MYTSYADIGGQDTEQVHYSKHCHWRGIGSTVQL